MADVQPVEEKKKGLSTLAWVGIGCAVVLLVIVLLMGACGFFLARAVEEVVENVGQNPVAFAAETLVRLNPNLELVESDREAGKITIREKSSDKVLTFNYEDIQEGRFSFEGEDGESLVVDGEDGVVSISTALGTARIGALEATDLPDWLPMYDGSAVESGGFSAVANEQRSGTFAFKSEDDVDEILAFYEKIMAGLDLVVTRAAYSSGDASVNTLSGTSDVHSLNVSVSQTAADGTAVQIVYQGPA